MKDFERILIITINDVYAHGFLFEKGPDRVNLVGHQRTLKTLPDKDLIEGIQASFKTGVDPVVFDRVEIIGDREDWFARATKTFSHQGVTLALFIDSGSTQVAYSSFGRVEYAHKFELGLASRLNELMEEGGYDYLRNWIQITGHEQSEAEALNFLANRSIFKSILPTTPPDAVALGGLMRLLLSRIKPSLPRLVPVRGSVLEKSINRLVLSGDFLYQLQDVIGDVLLSILDGLQVEGVWQIIIDPFSSMIVTGFDSRDTRDMFDNLGLIELVSTLTLSHNYPWGENLGSVKLDLGLSDNQELRLVSGEIVRMPLPADISGGVELDVLPNVEVVGYEGLDKIPGGQLGLVIDVRGRPLPNIEEVARYRQYYRHWQESVTDNIK